MAKTLNFRLGEQVLGFELGSKVDKRALYGYAKRIAEFDGTQLVRGLLLSDGRLLPAQSTSYVRVDPEGSPIEEPSLSLDGQPAELKPSSFDQEAPLESVPLSRLCAFQVRDVYPLQGAGLANGLYRTEFNYRKSAQPNEALLLVRDDAQAFLLVGQMKQPAFIGLAVSYDFFDAEGEAGEEEDSFDFSMV
ncbi:hypothetical protein [Pseudomarimonas arenosa]|uniref:Uncharacterized protein n=1 Tax=Pseudomarimonas arenosa TaxID=2774145 RepID=A0AAW3ZIB2_9GAMM|nr:hypothetical protein [Pseudomarimonas arenosa]MBD8525259.1 hypothetical protein [Pseudomarimonas arenosa]